MQNPIRIAAFAALFAAAPLTAALADRAPNAEESATISDILLSEGYSSWAKIEWDDGRWEVEDAIAQDGEKHDLTLDQAFVIISDDRDDDDDVKG